MTDEDGKAGKTGAGDGAKYQSLFRFMPQGIVLTRNRQIVEANAAAVALLGGSTEADLIGRRWIDLVDPRFKDIANGRREAMERGESLILPR